jgi:hypothetical protein
MHCSIISVPHIDLKAGTRWRSWLRHCATSQKVAGSIPDYVIGIFHWHNPSGRTVALRSTQPLTEMNTRPVLPWGVKAAGAYGWQAYHLHVPTVLKSVRLSLLEPLGPVQACNGIALLYTDLKRYLPICRVLTKWASVPPFHCMRGFVYGNPNDIGVVARLRAGRSGVLVTTDPRDWSLFINAKTGSGAHPARYSVSSWGSFPERNAGRAWGWSLIDISAEVKSEWNCTCIPLRVFMVGTEALHFYGLVCWKMQGCVFGHIRNE